MDELSFEVADLTGIAEDVQKLYTEVTKEDGTKSFRLAVKGVKPETEFTTVYSTMVKERERANELDKKIKAFGDFTPEAYNKLQSDFASLKASSSTKEEFIKATDQLKKDHETVLNAQKSAYETEKQNLEKDLLTAKQEIKNMMLERELEMAYTQSGYPEAFPLALRVAKDEIVWNEAVNQFRTKDGTYDVKDWVSNKLFRNYPNLLKGNISAGATQTSTAAGSWVQYFDPASPSYNMTKQVELSRTNKSLFNELRAKYQKK